MQSQPPRREPLVFSLDDLRNAAEQGVIESAAVLRLIEWQAGGSVPPTAADSGPASVERKKGLNLVTVAYYLGAMLMISACAWFLGDKWNILGSGGILITTLTYLAVSLSLGAWLRGQGYLIGGGLLITVAVCLVPLITYSVENLAGWWPSTPPGPYKDYYPLIRGSWIVMELSTMAAAAGALWFVRFGLLTAPFAFSAWFFSMDVWSLLQDKQLLTWEDRQIVSVYVGLATMLVGYGFDRILQRRTERTSEDFAFWCYLFGLLAFWGGLTSMHSAAETTKFLYALLNLGLMGIAIALRRATFLVFGALGVYIYLGHLAYEVFKDSFLFPFVLAFLGLSLILSAVAIQRMLLRSWRLYAEA